VRSVTLILDFIIANVSNAQITYVQIVFQTIQIASFVSKIMDSAMECASVVLINIAINANSMLLFAWDVLTNMD
jgi:uncharacterized protein with PhoU and TrkA domain